jgi:hypothetical protein
VHSIGIQQIRELIQLQRRTILDREVVGAPGEGGGLHHCVSPISRTHMGPNPSLLRFIKHMSRDSSKMSYIEHILSSSSSLKNKEVLTNHGGGELKEVGQVFWNPLW